VLPAGLSPLNTGDPACLGVPGESAGSLRDGSLHAVGEEEQRARNKREHTKPHPSRPAAGLFLHFCQALTSTSLVPAVMPKQYSAGRKILTMLSAERT